MCGEGGGRWGCTAVMGLVRGPTQMEMGEFGLDCWIRRTNRDLEAAEGCDPFTSLFVKDVFGWHWGGLRRGRLEVGRKTGQGAGGESERERWSLDWVLAARGETRQYIADAFLSPSSGWTPALHSLCGEAGRLGSRLWCALSPWSRGILGGKERRCCRRSFSSGALARGDGAKETAKPQADLTQCRVFSPSFFCFRWLFSLWLSWKMRMRKNAGVRLLRWRLARFYNCVVD